MKIKIWMLNIDITKHRHHHSIQQQHKEKKWKKKLSEHTTTTRERRKGWRAAVRVEMSERERKRLKWRNIWKFSSHFLPSSFTLCSMCVMCTSRWWMKERDRREVIFFILSFFHLLPHGSIVASRRKMIFFLPLFFPFHIINFMREIKEVSWCVVDALSRSIIFLLFAYVI